MNDANYKAVLIREPLKAKSDNWNETCHQWMVTLYGQTFDFYTGVGHREAKKTYSWNGDAYTYRQPKHKRLTDDGLKQLLALSKAVPPSVDDVIYALISDASATEQSFEEWCGELGFDTDSIKALDIYRQCQMNANKFRKTGLDINKERERLADY